VLLSSLFFHYLPIDTDITFQRDTAELYLDIGAIFLLDNGEE
jgi:hypothetical protein